MTLFPDSWSVSPTTQISHVQINLTQQHVDKLMKHVDSLRFQFRLRVTKINTAFLNEWTPVRLTSSEWKDDGAKDQG